ncbi:MAG: hypothetical protein V7K57_00050 [Nostoc sp.]|uniref:hypothetical protein n=1 Tax=Nostoc sp. TaxID=1180 RepID=UPI002FFB5B3E
MREGEDEGVGGDGVTCTERLALNEAEGSRSMGRKEQMPNAQFPSASYAQSLVKLFI